MVEVREPPGGSRQDTAPASSLWVTASGFGAAPGTPLISVPSDCSGLCSELLPGFTPQNPGAGEVLQVMMDVQPLGKAPVLFVQTDRQTHSASVAAALPPVPSSL